MNLYFIAIIQVIKLSDVSNDLISDEIIRSAEYNDVSENLITRNVFAENTQFYQTKRLNFACENETENSPEHKKLPLKHAEMSQKARLYENEKYENISHFKKIHETMVNYKSYQKQKSITETNFFEVIENEFKSNSEIQTIPDDKRNSNFNENQSEVIKEKNCIYSTRIEGLESGNSKYISETEVNNEVKVLFKSFVKDGVNFKTNDELHDLQFKIELNKEVDAKSISVDMNVVNYQPIDESKEGISNNNEKNSDTSYKDECLICPCCIS